MPGMPRSSARGVPATVPHPAQVGAVARMHIAVTTPVDKKYYSSPLNSEVHDGRGVVPTGCSVMSSLPFPP